MKERGKKYDLSDTTLIIPLRVDSIVRLENMLMSINYMLKYFKINITVLQAASYENDIVPRLIDKKVQYQFVEDYDTVFYRTKYLNRMTKESDTPYIGIWDADVIVPKEQIAEAVGKLHEDYVISFPYDGHFYDTTDIIREQFWKSGNIQTLKNNQAKMGLIYGTNTKGGAIFVNREAYITAGMENEKFYGWGPEDFERYERWKGMDYKIYQTEGPLYHLTHSRGNNSTFRSIEQAINMNKEKFLTSMSSRDEILKQK
jgi:hypothetical protein